MLSSIELTILTSLIYNETYTRKVLPYVKAEYFEASVSRTLFEITERFFSEYDKCPTSEAIAIAIEATDGLP